MRLVQFLTEKGSPAVAQVHGDQLRLIKGPPSTYALAQAALSQNLPLEALVTRQLSDELVDYATVREEGRLLAPIEHPHTTQFWITGTGLTHSGSAAARDAMHAKLETGEPLSDSMKIFQMGLEGGKPTSGESGVQPEWFYKGNGSIVVPPNGTLNLPPFALDGGEEPEIAGIYLIGDDGTPYRLGHVLGNEYSDHVMERINYLYLAHSKLRPCSFGPELLLGELPKEVKGTASVLREGKTIWTKEFLSGEAHMIHSLDNLEQHHFKYDLFRNPGDLHAHFFGTATLSFAEGITIKVGDTFVIDSTTFGKPLINTVGQGRSTFKGVKRL